MKSLNFKQKLAEDIKLAIAYQQKDRLRALQSLGALLSLEERRKKKDTLTDDEIVRLLLKTSERKKIAIETYRKQRREVLVKIESDELAVIQQYLPKQLSEKEICEIVDRVIARISVQGMQDVARVVRIAKEEIGQGARGRVILRIVREQLNNSL